MELMRLYQTIHADHEARRSPLHLVSSHLQAQSHYCASCVALTEGRM